MTKREKLIWEERIIYSKLNKILMSLLYNKFCFLSSFDAGFLDAFSLLFFSVGMISAKVENCRFFELGSNCGNIFLIF